MSEFPTLAEVVVLHPVRLGNGVLVCGCTKTFPCNHTLWGEHVQEVWREACTITTFDDLYALPVGCIVRFSSGTTDEREKTGWCWGPTEHEFAFADGENALVIWHPDWSKA
ncbi:hypothetical protein [Mycolicibacterium fortuitum]|uniref:hypothetical protein n=1 Tax=Mycolicibacterium fortuitum TaxID=1766 RepID=UPI00241D5AFC|nr:hypothetical protein [Mycolicibacterium fortuitum]MDG5773908.1 hypothetical protein [Mycolicibacterium fortuitum]MDG5779707.1 hypothetical protein [Mycolicibacterium fortuitum]